MADKRCEHCDWWKEAHHKTDIVIVSRWGRCKAPSPDSVRDGHRDHMRPHEGMACACFAEDVALANAGMADYARMLKDADEGKL